MFLLRALYHCQNMSNPQFEKLQKILATNDMVGAERVCRAAIKANRNDVNMIAVLGAVLMRTNRLEEAERNLRQAIKVAPTFAKAHEDLGVLLMRRKSPEQAEKHFRKAVELRPDMGSAWFGLVHALKDQDNLPQARHICGKILASNPDNLEAMRLMAIIAGAEGLLPEAGRLLRQILEKQPNSLQAVKDLAGFHADQHQYTEAIELFRRATELAPGDASLHFKLGRCLFVTGFPEEATQAYDAGLAIEPDSEGGQTGRLHALRNLGRTDEVVEGCRRCIQQGVNVCESWWSLSSLRTCDFTDDDLQQMTSLRDSADLSESDSAYLDFALGKAMDDRDSFDEAWDYYVSANDARRNVVYYDGVGQEARVDGIIESIDADLLQQAIVPEAGPVTPIFVLGMPRSGSTLVEQILASHSSVEATTELPYLKGLGERYLVGNFAGTAEIRDVGPRKLGEIRDQYLSAVETHRTNSSPYFIDKQPENFLYIGLIALTLPGAKIIDIRRNPLDTCIGNYRQWFGKGKEFSYDLIELADYYLQYRRLMDHWNALLPGSIHTVSYEDLVDNTETEIRKLLSYCELPFEDACLNFHESTRAVTTASSEQVRQPIYKSAVGFWKHYEPHLDELKEMLGDVLD